MHTNNHILSSVKHIDRLVTSFMLPVSSPSKPRVHRSGKTHSPSITSVASTCSADYIVAARMNLGVAPFSNMPSSCGFCSKPIGNDGVNALHGLCCQYDNLKGSDITHRHNDVQHVVETYASRAEPESTFFVINTLFASPNRASPLIHPHHNSFCRSI